LCDQLTKIRVGQLGYLDSGINEPEIRCYMLLDWAQKRDGMLFHLGVDILRPPIFSFESYVRILHGYQRQN